MDVWSGLTIAAIVALFVICATLAPVHSAIAILWMMVIAGVPLALWLCFRMRPRKRPQKNLF